MPDTEAFTDTVWVRELWGVFDTDTVPELVLVVLAVRVMVGVRVREEVMERVAHMVTRVCVGQWDTVTEVVPERVGEAEEVGQKDWVTEGGLVLTWDTVWVPELTPVGELDWVPDMV